MAIKRDSLKSRWLHLFAGIVCCGFDCACACMCVCVHVHMCVCMHVCARECMCVHMHVFFQRDRALVFGS